MGHPAPMRCDGKLTSAASCLAFVLLGAMSAPLACGESRSSPEVSQAVRAGFPAYTPPISPEGETIPPASDRPAPRPLKRLSDPYARLPEKKLPPTPNVSATPTTGDNPAPSGEGRDKVVLPKMTITGKKDPSRPLPTLHVPAPLRDLPADPFETPDARRARLIKKHLAPLEARLLGPAAAASRAEEREAIASATTELNDIAALLEISAAAGLDSPEEQKRLHAEYYRAYYGRPR